MKQRIIGIAVAGAILTSVLVALGATTTVAGALNYGRLNAIQRRIISGFVSSELSSQGATTSPRPAAASLLPAPAGALANYVPLGTGQCSQTLGGNVKVNQNCLNLTDSDLQGRAQAKNETSIAQDPRTADPPRGQRQRLPPRRRHVRRRLHRRRAAAPGRTRRSRRLHPGGDLRRRRPPVLAGRRRHVGRLGHAGQRLPVLPAVQPGHAAASNPDLSSAFYVFRSTGNDGASWNFPGRPVAESSSTPSGSGVPAFEDKQLLTVDNHVGSPFRDRVYVTWTEFAADGTRLHLGGRTPPTTARPSARGPGQQRPARSAPTPSAPGRRTGTATRTSSPSRSPARRRPLHRLRQLQQPVAKPGDGGGGDAPVTGDNRYQMLIAKSTDGGNTFSAPVKVCDYYDLPDCATYQGGHDPVRACVPEKGGDQQLVLPGDQLPVGRGRPDATRARSWSPSAPTSTRTPTRPTAACRPASRPLATRSTPGVKTAGRLQQRHPRQRVQRRRRDVHGHDAPIRGP